MIVYYLLKLFASLGNVLTLVFGRADILPWGTDAYVVLFWGWCRYIVTSAWPLIYIVQVFGIYLTWRIGVLVVRLIFGSRAPVQ